MSSVVDNMVHVRHVSAGISVVPCICMLCVSQERTTVLDIGLCFDLRAQLVVGDDVLRVAQTSVV